MKYYVTFKIDARYIAEVEADSLDDARRKANLKYMEADFGKAEDIYGEDIIVEDENGNFIWEQ